MKPRATPLVGTDEQATASMRFVSWMPALLLAQLALSAWAVGRALPPGEGSIQVIAAAIGNQLLFLLRALPILFLLTWPLLKLRDKRLRLLAVGMLWSLFLLFQAGLEQYYLMARTPLGADLFGYGIEEIRTTTGGAGSALGIVDWFGWLLPPGVLWTVLALRARRTPRSRQVWPWLLAGVASWFLPVAVGIGGLGGETQRDIATSKGTYLVADSLRAWRGSSVLAIGSANAGARTAGASAAVQPDYPFLHPESTPDALGPFFGPTRDGRPPNIVVIIVEGLGRSFSGPDAPLGSFTPFLDDLAARGLYFDNFMANQGRTFGVLPSLFGSLPMADQGFAALGPKMPAHAGLFNVLRRQGYRSAFYNGTDTSFDNERGYLQLQEVDDIVDLRNFGTGYQRNPFSDWGYPDRELVSRVLADSGRLRSPFVLGIQTISMHTSYRFPGQEAYTKRFEQQLDALGVPALLRSKYRANAEIYSTILYTDDQLRRYFEAVAKTGWYANTIFLVTGDHRLAEIPQDTHIERYHVPLLVYSPLLRRPARIRGVSSHLDVAPSLLALLSNTYGLRRPQQVTWLGRGLDMSADFHSGHDFPLKQTKTSVPDFVSGRWFLHDGKLYELQDGIRASEVGDANLTARTEQRLQRYLAANAAFLQRLALSPEGGAPRLVPFAETANQVAARPPPETEALPAGLGLDAVKLARSGKGIEIIATFANGDAVDSSRFVPLAVLATENGRELGEAYGSAIQLRGHERREVLLTLTLPMPAQRRYFVSVLPSSPDSGKPLGRGRYRIPLDATGEAP
ncbi:alkaline phosphatase family protein [Thermomonas sp. HDW16]|uniref:LTA synthase family protein n=1 Tax=Thermomonas sp. HDW16 TaxID=2714945 RepID=UPI001407F054|nr:alkaline phosphatase family protein [Thermomonas sp. HDW16]QIL19601.1 sulfatase-like hydrolase/transferase [Thermomonas sp. HDW16]